MFSAFASGSLGETARGLTRTIVATDGRGRADCHYPHLDSAFMVGKHADERIGTQSNGSSRAIRASLPREVMRTQQRSGLL